MISFFLFRARAHLIVKGLSGAPPGSQEGLRSRLASVLASVGSDAAFVVNSVVVYPARGNPVYEVVLDTPLACERLIKDFFRFTRRRDPVSRPHELNGVAIYHSVTSGTRVRISLLRVSFEFPTFLFCFTFLL